MSKQSKLRPESIEAINTVLDGNSPMTSCIITFDYYEDGEQVTDGCLCNQRDSLIMHVNTTTHATKLGWSIFLTDGNYTASQLRWKITIKEFKERWMNGNEIITNCLFE